MQQQPRLPLWFLVANWALVVGAFVFGVVLGGRNRLQLPEPQGSALQLIYQEILSSHVDPHDGHQLLDRALADMVHGLDPYSMYVPPSEVAAYDERNSGHYEGVGLLMEHIGEDVVVQYPFPGGPADRAGVLPGDRIVAVDGELLANTVRERRHGAASRLVRGPAGTEVRLLMARDDGTVELAMERGDVQRSPVKWAHFADPDQGLAYVYISDFHPGVADQFVAAITELQQRRPLAGLVLDVRHDPGGNLAECVAVARTFLRSGTIVSQRRRDSEVVETSVATPEACRYPELPLVVLVNERSASASEVLAGAMQDHGRAAIVGVRTWGKGYVNTVYEWKDLDFRLKLTTANFYTPNGRNIDGHVDDDGGEAQWRRNLLQQVQNGARTIDDALDAWRAGPPPTKKDSGIVPDVVVEIDEARRRELQVTLADHEPPPEYQEAFAAVAARYGLSVPRPPQADRDPQLAQALVTLRERVAAHGATTEPR